jgi:TnpA family transposase
MTPRGPGGRRRSPTSVLDGLLENDTILRPYEQSTDTHGFTEQLFGLCYLLGYSFMPRLRDLADQQLYRVDPENPPESLRPLLRAGLDLSLLDEQWDQLVRVAASLRNRVASAHVVLQQLAMPRQRIGWTRPDDLGRRQDHLHPTLHSRGGPQAAGPAAA